MQVVFAGDFFQLPPVVKRETEKSVQTELIEKLNGVYSYDELRIARMMLNKK